MTTGSGLFSNKRAHKPHLVEGKGGVPGEVDDLRRDVTSTLAALAALTVEEFTDPPAAAVAGVLASVASQAAAASYVAADLVGGAAVELDPPRNPTLTCDDSATTWTGNVTITGVDANGDAASAVIAFTNNATTPAAVALARIDSIDADAQNNALGNWSVGWGDVIGLGKPLVSRAGAAMVVQEIEAGTVLAADAVTGTFVDAATSAPNGTYEPATVPDGTNDYALLYEYDPTA